MYSQKSDEAFYEMALIYAEYSDENGYLPTSFVTPAGNKIGLWGHNIRQGRIRVTPERAKILKTIKFMWSPKEYLKEQRLLKREKERKRKTFDEWLAIFDEWHKNGYISSDFVTPKGEQIGRWATRVRTGIVKVNDEQKKKLNERNFVWVVTDEIWKSNLQERRSKKKI